MTRDRAESADTLEKPSMRGVKTSVVEKYSDQAHFIYELLQNADDAGATCARFELHKDELIFAHNGTRRFSISNPETEESDSNENKLGDINAITSIANSNKTTASIGKFGVGFKAVFQYTQTPQIYDSEFRFRIERFIVPIEMEDEHIGRRNEETLFVFPFDHADRDPEEAYEAIYNKLRTLIYPVLFLTNLQEISFECSERFGIYTKSVVNEIMFENTKGCLMTLTQNNGDDVNELIQDKLWLFTRINEQGLAYSVGYKLGQDDILQKVNHTAFCYFPTKEVTGLNFIVHAPFLLTDSREGIKAGEKHNKKMIVSLAELAGDSLLYLKKIQQTFDIKLLNDHILDIIPYDESKFSNIEDNSKISFKPFYSVMKNIFSKEELLPSYNGFAQSRDAYWASYPEIANVFSNDQLAQLTHNENAKWTFPSLGRDEVLRSQRELAYYIDSITSEYINHDKIISLISAEFIECQSYEWLHKFYKYISESNIRRRLVKTKPIFLNQDQKAVAAYDSNDQVILFIPVIDVAGYETIDPDLLENPDTLEFVMQIGIKEPSLRDEIYNVIIPQYKVNEGINTEPHFRKFFKYYLECPQAEVDEYIDLIKNCSFIKCRTANYEKVYRGKASDLYFPDQILAAYFTRKSSVYFVELDEYKSLVDEEAHSLLEKFLIKLGVRKEPRIFESSLNEQQAYRIKPKYEWARPTQHNMHTRRWLDRSLDGCKELLENMTSDNTIILWQMLLKLISKPTTWRRNWQSCTFFEKAMTGEYNYFFRNHQTDYFDSSEALRLKTGRWLLNNKDELVSAKELTIESLSSLYDISSNEARMLLEFLNIKNEEIKEDEDLSDEQRAKILLADALSDIPPEELKRFAEQYRAQRQAASRDPEKATDDDDANEGGTITSIDPILSRVAKEISNRAVSAQKEIVPDRLVEDQIPNTIDEDNYTKHPVDYSKKIELAKKRSADEIKNIAQLEELTQRVLSFEKYSYGWFKSLLELETLNSSENNNNSKEVSISFSKVEREEGTARTLILKHPSRYIPHFMEDLSDIPLELFFRDRPTIKVAVEVVNIRSYTLRAKLKTNAQIDGLDLSLVIEARIEAKSPVFLLAELQKGFNELGFDDKYDLQSNLCENIEFVFGPPGTGKTTYLVNNILLPLMRSYHDLKVLVLTPTNKAADVLVSRVMEIMGLDKTYHDWLIRFGTTHDLLIEQSGVYRDKTIDIRTFSRNVTVTTIARFPYDYFMPDETMRLYLHMLKWDYIVIDEASMIPLINIIYPLYLKTPEKFIIAGDPFQIEPITSVDLWKNENIYTMVKLESFTQPTTIPHPYMIKLLTTQYRSIPEIGEVFSHFIYGGILKHDRTSDSKKALNIAGLFDVRALNIIKFPVSKYESIYRPKRLRGKSTYQIYSALFAFEFTKYLSTLIGSVNKNTSYKIGVIAPYRAQSDLIDKLMASEHFPWNIDIQVGTIHGFQGDECDIMIAVFNSPPSISKSPEMFLNKRNIINVSVSRARDYLFVIMPDDETENVDDLILVKQIENLFKKQHEWIETHSRDIEEVIFGNKYYLENNAFSTSHQLVNVYSKPERRYEIRSEESAVDVQIHNQV